jgi:pimeloyl-ACP methyl ester carboxylesterase
MSGDEADKTVSTSIHSRPLAAAVPNAKLIVLPGIGHIVHYAAPELVVREVETMIGEVAHSTAAAAAK